MKRVPENDDVRNGAKKALMRGLLPHCYVRVGERASLLEIAAGPWLTKPSGTRPR
jgi:hypothetical protein